ncbi:hypothetical protein SteCoe_8929 [Stentor coeruleus]|uniref:Cache domain-containing protein n=1 Tax=Stentor coeruleus TaxID=5963 RepID=A0A1R2CJ02_9CILI|nr:hypothetical protein SteCoe_8929 [Stentor coeruleus]
MSSKSSLSLESNLLQEIRSLGLRQSLYLSSLLGFYSNKLLFYTEQTKVALNQSKIQNPITSTLNFVDSKSLEGLDPIYEYFSYFSKHEELDFAYDILESLNPLNDIFPMILNKGTESLFIGFYADELYCTLPGEYVSNSLFTPLIKEWFYDAVWSTVNVMMTEPYLNNENNMWKIAFSKAIVGKDNEVLGAMALEILLEDINDKLSKISILKTGFVMLVSGQGTVVVSPYYWGSSTSMRIYDETYTGITEQQWENMQNGQDGDKYDIKSFNNTDFICVLYKVQSPYNISFTSFYIIVMANVTDMKAPLDDLDLSYNKAYVLIFWFVLCVALTVLIITLFLIYFESKGISFQLKLVERVFEKIVNRGLFPIITKGVKFDKLDQNSHGIEKFVKSMKIYIEKLKIREEEFSLVKWEKTRPDNQNIFSNWEDFIYPFNVYSSKNLKLREAIFYLEKLLNPD